MTTATLALLTLFQGTLLGGSCQGVAQLTCDNDTEFAYSRMTAEAATLNFTHALNGQSEVRCFYDVQDEGSLCGARGFFTLEVVNNEVESFSLDESWSWVE